jgi:adenosylcobinamide kinase/adenosylcobinamide-phosphate guanylyltransferase
MLPKLTLVLGGAACGKSAFAENLLLTSGLEPVYVATSRVFDAEMETKIKIHRSRRYDLWHEIEADLNLNAPLSSLETTQAVLIDCATMWLTNQMMDGNDIAKEQIKFLNALNECPAPVVVVSNEVGHGIVPNNALARQFREAQGRLNIALAQQSDTAVMVVAGLPQLLKGTLP